MMILKLFVEEPKEEEYKVAPPKVAWIQSKDMITVNSHFTELRKSSTSRMHHEVAGTPEEGHRFLRLLERWHLSPYVHMHAYLLEKETESEDLPPSSVPSGWIVLLLPHTVTSTILSMYWTCGTSMEPQN